MDFLDRLKSAWSGEDTEGDLYPDETESPKLNLLIRTARKVAEGRAEPSALLAEIEAATDRLETALAEHERLLSLPDLSDEILEVAGRVSAAYADFRQGLEEMTTYLDHPDPASLERGIERCKAAIEVLLESNRQFEAIHQREQMVACLMCGHLNQPRSRTCARCEAVLPDEMERSAAVREEEGAGDMVVVPPEYMELYQACDQVASGKIPVEEWRPRVEGLLGIFSQTRHQVASHLGRHPEVLETHAELAPVADSLVEGLGRAEEALRRMLLYEQEAEADHLNYGWMDLLKATRQVQEATLIFHRALAAVQEGGQE